MNKPYDPHHGGSANECRIETDGERLKKTCIINPNAYHTCLSALYTHIHTHPSPYITSVISHYIDRGRLHLELSPVGICLTSALPQTEQQLQVLAW